MVQLAPRGLAALAVSSSLILTACFSSPNQPGVSNDVKQLSHSKTIAVGEGPHGITYAGGTIVNSNPGREISRSSTPRPMRSSRP